MATTDISTLATTNFTSLGAGMLVVLGAFLGLAVAYLLFKFSWRKIKGSTR